MPTLREKLHAQQRFAAQVAEWNRCAEDCIKQILAMQPPVREDINRLMHQYLRWKFCTTDEEYAQTDNIIELARLSIKRALKNGAIFYDQRDCHGVSESMEKKMLMITDVEQKIGYTFPVECYIQIDTVSDLSDQIYAYLTQVRR